MRLVTAACGVAAVIGGAFALARSGSLSSFAGGRELVTLLAPLGAALILVAAVAGSLDVVLARRRYFRQVGMTREELQRELQDLSGNPIWRDEQRRFWLERLESGSGADVLIGDPAAIAVAIVTEPSGAARVLFVRRGRSAARAWQSARRCGVTTLRNASFAFQLASLTAGAVIPSAWLELIVPEM